jgi:hypothetical protein
MGCEFTVCKVIGESSSFGLKEDLNPSYVMISGVRMSDFLPDGNLDIEQFTAFD